MLERRALGPPEHILHRPDAFSAIRSRERDDRGMPVMTSLHIREDRREVVNEGLPPMNQRCTFFRRIDHDIFAEDVCPFVPALLVHEEEVARLELTNLLDFDEVVRR